MPGLAFFLLLFVATNAALAAPPATPKKPVVDTYWGETITDDYRWLEDWNDPQVRDWSDAQNRFARALLDSLPSRGEIEKRATQLMSWQSPSYYGLTERRGRYFMMEQQPPKQQGFLVVMESVDHPETERVLVDPNVLDATGGLTIDWFVPSFDGTIVAVSLSRNGTEAGDVHLYDVATGQERAGEIVPRANSGTAGGSLAWNRDGTGFWYTRHPSRDEVAESDLGFFQRVYFHRLGTKPEADAYSLGRELPRNAENFLDSCEPGRVLDLVQKGDGGEYELYLLDARQGTWHKAAAYEDRVIAARFGLNGDVWLLSRKNAGRGKVLCLPARETELAKARTIVPEGGASIEGFEVSAERLWVIEQLGGPSGLHIYDLVGQDLGEASISPVSSVFEIARDGRRDLLFESGSFVAPSAWFRADPAGKLAATGLAETSPVDMRDIEVLRLTATSKDGTKVPLTLLQRKGTKHDGNNPALLTGYGGFNISTKPGFSKIRPLWLEQGGVIAVANIRGGSEFGEAWHAAGSLTNKQHVFDDFIACAEELIKEGVTNPSKLAIEGASNGGLLMGAALTQRPDLFRAVVARVGYFDMLRYETRPNGVFNSTEYGSVANKKEYRALKEYSPYHNVREGVHYPPALFMTGANDPRVDPLHSRKMVARLQAAGATAILRTSGSTGHVGTPLSEEIAEEVDVFSFLMSELGMMYRPLAQ